MSKVQLQSADKNADLPFGWSVVPLAKMADKDKVNSFIDGDWIEARYIASEGIRLIQTGNIDVGRFKDKEKKRFVSEQTFDELRCKEVYPGDILICRLADPIGRACIVPNTNERLITAVDVTIFRPEESKYSIDFLIQLLNYRGTLKEVSSYTSGSTRQRISRSNLGNVVLAVPPLAEQSKIAAILKSVDDIIEKTTAIIKQTEILKRGLMQMLLKKGIGHTMFKQTEIGEIPTEWDVVKLSECANIKSGVTKGRKVNGQQLISVPYLRVANVQDGYLDLDEIKYIEVTSEELHRYKLYDGDVLLTEGGDADKLGRGYIWHNEVPNCIHQNHVFRVRTDASILLPEYFTYLAASPYGKRYFMGCAKQTTNLASINSTQLKDFPVPLPSLTEQKHLAFIFSTLDTKMNIERKTLKGLKTTKQSLMQVLLTGKVRVNVDEPSEVTL
ncbi:restriction endonuclease subunit S [Tumebacillus lipolyticus]|uniref:Restriction endonuclease subunit S n=1 Tax=Tumebacillus lipolyticus TaxID=1280370 RepID=A0ABW4ZYE7_9BACL